MRTLNLLSVALLLLFGSVASLKGDEVVTIAGTGEPLYAGDGGASFRAGVGGPFGVVVGPDGAVYVCETTSHVVRRIDEAAGTVSTIAGSGKKGYSGDGGPATQAELNEPYEVRFDQAGNMYFVEMKNHLVRRVDAKTGKISTVAGNGTAGFSGDGGPAREAQLKVPHSIALDHAGQLYICDIGNHRIRRVDLKLGIISTFSGTGQQAATPDGAPLAGTPLNGPRALAFDGGTNLMLALREGNAVYRIDLTTKRLHHLAGTGKPGYAGDGGSAKQARLSGPKGIAVGTNGDIYLADTESHTIRAIRKRTGIIETIVGDGVEGDGPDGVPRKCRLARPHGVFVDAADNVYVGDSSNHRVRRLIVASAETGDDDAKDWTRLPLDDQLRSEGVAAADVNRDGRTDVFAGDVWYEAPESANGVVPSAGWTMHAIRPVGEYNPAGGYADSFSNFAYDVNGDAWDDLILIGFPGEKCFWYENPQNKSGHWKEHLIWHSACNESPAFADLSGDGRPELFMGSQPESQLGFLSVPSPDQTNEPWTFQAISRPGNRGENGTHRYYHGLGSGDLNNDGKTDVLIPHGWWEGPIVSSSEHWTFHPLMLAKPGAEKPLRAAHMSVDDLDLDGDNDILMSSAHTYGVWWFENVSGNEASQFRYHLIDDAYSQTHAMHYVDVNGDGQNDLVTGKRYFAHNGNDPGGKEPVVMYWYEIQRQAGRLPRFLRHEIIAGRDTGIGTQFAVEDMNGDGRIDIVLSNKKGVNLLLQAGP